MSDETSAVSESAETDATDPRSVEELPAWAKGKISEANNEAAKYRVRARESAEQAKAEATAEFETQIDALTREKETAIAARERAELETTKMRAVVRAGIPGESVPDFVELVQGTTEDEITAHVDKLKYLFTGQSQPPRAVDPSQGLGNGEISEEHQFGTFILNKLDS